MGPAAAVFSVEIEAIRFLHSVVIRRPILLCSRDGVLHESAFVDFDIAGGLRTTVDLTIFKCTYVG